MTTATQDEQRTIAQTILHQCKARDQLNLAACGSRNYVALDRNDDRRGGVQFRVTIKRHLFHVIIIELTHLDEYKVTLWGGKRKATDGAVVKTVDAWCENLGDVVYSLCNPE
jgi:hypothetical protein